MRLTFLGTGSAMPAGERFQTGLLLESGENNLVIDCGSGTLHGLARTDVGYEGVETVLLTHHHLDHVSDLMVLVKARWLAGEESLTVAGPPGTEDLVTGLFEVHEYMQDRIDLTIREVEPTDGEPVELAGFEIAAHETRHSLYCLAYRVVSGEGRSCTYSGDTEAFEELIEFADGSAVLVHDSSFPDGVDVSNHPTPTQLGTALDDADADIGRVYLSHFFPHTQDKHEEMLSSIEDHYDGAVEFARDGLTVEFA